MIAIVTLAYKKIRKPAWPERAKEVPTLRRGQRARYGVKKTLPKSPRLQPGAS